MKYKKNIYIFGIALVLSFSLILFTVVNSDIPAFTIHKFEMLLIIIGFGATFGGAYLGAKLSGDYAVKTSELKHKLEISNYERRAEYIQTSYYNQAVRIINDMRPQDFAASIKISIDEERKISLGPVFKENHYTPLDQDKLDKLNKMIEKINEFRLSEGYFYLNINKINELENMGTLLEDVTYGFIRLNMLNKEGTSESNHYFNTLKNETFNKLEKLYNLKEKEIILKHRTSR